MEPLPIQSIRFVFTSPGKYSHILEMTVTPSIDLQWQLYINGVDVAYHLDTKTNILIPANLDRALSWDNVTSVYNTLLAECKVK